ncbi:hypothetical protein HII36_38810 [Nonomuraea sp. NN258]|uniref:hypothetical protein n=1 Tax=Nonomuraea antri TaxID=2730852 RepID=UPI00156A009D|nr:hypothetical protein [Nonomuraea antri]NRQ37739.1 hypothetical protein [Nonomuraea antri]
MHDAFESRESWPFECLRCLHVWEEDYVVRHLTDDHGNDVDVWSRSGAIVQPPWSGTCCPACGAFHTTSFPSGYLSRHPELLAAPDPEPLVRPPAGPPATPVERIEPAARRTSRPGRRLIAVGVPVVLFVGYEVYANVVEPLLRHH